MSGARKYIPKREIGKIRKQPPEKETIKGKESKKDTKLASERTNKATTNQHKKERDKRNSEQLTSTIRPRDEEEQRQRKE